MNLMNESNRWLTSKIHDFTAEFASQLVEDFFGNLKNQLSHQLYTLCQVAQRIFNLSQFHLESIDENEINPEFDELVQIRVIDD
jgi:hypothetical protein